MSKQEWQKSKDSDIEFDYYIWLGPVCFRLLDYGRGWRVFVPSNLNYYLEITPMSPEEAQAAALAWARSVLGKALVEAGADVVDMFVCDECNTISNRAGPCLGGGEKDLEPFKYARIEGA